jgi:hypothetical protein
LRIDRYRHPDPEFQGVFDAITPKTPCNFNPLDSFPWRRTFLSILFRLTRDSGLSSRRYLPTWGMLVEKEELLFRTVMV